MNKSATITELLGDTDIYLIDQIMKGRYKMNDTILDAGCGPGRNLHWFLQKNMNIYGIDNNKEAISYLKTNYRLLPPERFQLSTVEQMPFPDNYFDHIISSAVLHFSGSTSQFHSMIKEMVRVLKSGGSLFIRMTSDIGIEDKALHINDGVYSIPDGSTRFLLTRPLVAMVIKKYQLSFLEPLKTVNVDDVRCMSTLMLQKD